MAALPATIQASAPSHAVGLALVSGADGGAAAARGGKESRNEKLKLESKHLRGTLKEELNDLSKSGFGKTSGDLLKFHGIYQEQNRDADAKSSANPAIFMLRGRIAGGRMTPEQYLMYDKLATKYGHGSIRLTTRQTIQFHWIAKGDLKPVFKGLTEVLSESKGACGDIVRNVTCVPNVLGDSFLTEVEKSARSLSDHFKSTANAYNEVWLDGQQVNADEEKESLYGEKYLPRKFKIGITAEGNNSIDLLTNDLGLSATKGPDGQVSGYHVYVGGGHGRSHNAPETWAGHAQHLGWVERGRMMDVAEAVVKVQRDAGDRANRKHARMKYTVEDNGLDWIRAQVEKYSGTKLEPPGARPIADWTVPKYLGWHKLADGSFGLGVHVLSGRIIDQQGSFLKTALRRVVERYQLPVELLPDQDIMLKGIPTSAKADIEKIFRECRVDVNNPMPKIYERSLACVAFPTCSLAITESERYLPQILPRMNALLKKHGFKDEAPVFRITGCPNGCARPYTAELAFVGQEPAKDTNGGSYQVYVGGSASGSRVAELLVEKWPAGKMTPLLDNLFAAWKKNRIAGETFGDFTHRLPRPVLNDMLSVIPSSMRLDSISKRCGVTPGTERD
ncbi:Sulfite reductase [Diplonema papillatum]|nr:Sulfite reductase [Diplonema papillatum]